MASYNVRGKNGRFVKKSNLCNCTKCNKVQEKPVTRVALVIDKSGSMYYLQKQAIETINNWLDKNKNEANINNQTSLVNIYRFDSKFVCPIYKDLDCNSIDKFYDYHPGGQTALLEATFLTITDLEQRDDNKCSFLVIVITDGEENASQQYYIDHIAELMRSKIKTGRWTIAFLVPKGNAHHIKQYGISLDNIQEWEVSEQGLKTAEIKTSGGLSNYYSARSAGQSAVQSFFVKTDLSNVTQNDIKKSLDDISNACKIYNVEKEVDIKPFVESKTGKAYTPGSAYYLLIKKEKVSSKKGVCVVKKGEKTVWGGQEARSLIGLPNNADTKVEPYDHGPFEIYIQSHSNNRILPRGTKLLIMK